MHRFPCVCCRWVADFAFAVLKLWLDQMRTASADKRFRSFLVSGLCTGAYSAIYHLPCSGMCLGASCKCQDEHGKLLLTLGGNRKELTEGHMHSAFADRIATNE